MNTYILKAYECDKIKDQFYLISRIKLLEILNNYYPDGEFNDSRQRMAKMPAASELILNPISLIFFSISELLNPVNTKFFLDVGTYVS